MSLIRAEMSHSINGVPGRMHNLRVPPAPWKVGTFANQTWNSMSRPVSGYGAGATLSVEITFDDNCKNGHNTFHITGEVRNPVQGSVACGCLHEDITSVFPELAHLIRWHGTSTDGPMHYLANTTYLAGNRDSSGLLKGEKRQIVNGRTKLPCWHLAAIVNGEEIPLYKLPSSLDSETCPVAPEIKYVPRCKVGEGKERELDAARRSAVWPEATDEQLSLPKAELSALLESRLPGLLQAFRADVEACGFLWSSEGL